MPLVLARLIKLPLVACVSLAGLSQPQCAAAQAGIKHFRRGSRYSCECWFLVVYCVPLPLINAFWFRLTADGYFPRSEHRCRRQWSMLSSLSWFFSARRFGRWRRQADNKRQRAGVSTPPRSLRGLWRPDENKISLPTLAMSALSAQSTKPATQTTVNKLHYDRFHRRISHE